MLAHDDAISRITDAVSGESSLRELHAWLSAQFPTLYQGTDREAVDLVAKAIVAFDVASEDGVAADGLRYRLALLIDLMPAHFATDVAAGYTETSVAVDATSSFEFGSASAYGEPGEASDTRPLTARWSAARMALQLS